MIINLRSLPPGPRYYHFVLHEDWWKSGGPEGPVVGQKGPIEVAVTLEAAGDKYVLEGTLSGSILVACDRCLEPFVFDLKTSFRLFLSVVQNQEGRMEIELIEEDMEVDFVQGEKIEIDDIVQEQIHLALPMKCLCHDGCQGLCAVCGKNRNVESCQCRDDSGHRELFKLRKLNIEGVE
jgi:uncharacterized protein